MNDLQLLQAIFAHIREHGTTVENKPGLGGIWSADTYTLGEFRAQLQDDGSTQAVIYKGLYAASTYGRDVQYFTFGRKATTGPVPTLAEVYALLFPNSSVDQTAI